MATQAQYDDFLQEHYKTPPSTLETIQLNGYNPSPDLLTADNPNTIRVKNTTYINLDIHLGRGSHATVSLIYNVEKKEFYVLRTLNEKDRSPELETHSVLPYLGRTIMEWSDRKDRYVRTDSPDTPWIRIQDKDFTKEVFYDGLSQINAQLKKAHGLGVYHGGVKWENITWRKEQGDDETVRFIATVVDWPSSPQPLKTDITAPSEYSLCTYPEEKDRYLFWDNQADFYSLGKDIAEPGFQWSHLRDILGHKSITKLNKVAHRMQKPNPDTTANVLEKFLQQRNQSKSQTTDSILTDQHTTHASGGSAGGGAAAGSGTMAISKPTLFSPNTKGGADIKAGAQPASANTSHGAA